MRRFSANLPHGPIENRRFRLAVTTGTLSWKNGFSSHCSFLDDIDTLIDSFAYFHISRW
jgi:hypothetical protein